MSLNVLGPYIIAPTTICFRGTCQSNSNITLPPVYGPYTDLTVQITQTGDTEHIRCYTVPPYTIVCYKNMNNNGFSIRTPGYNRKPFDVDWIAHATFVPSY